MRLKLQLFLILLSWFMATGSQWDVVQVFAWGRMMTVYLQTVSVAKAVELTFDADKPCPICRAVRKAKQTQENATAPSSAVGAKVVLLFQPAPEYVFIRPERNPWSRCDLGMVSAERAAPPLTPPRAVEV